MTYQCEECRHIFSSEQAKCEDWSVVEKSFICPNCDTYLVNPFSHKLDFRKSIVGLAWAVPTGLFIGAIGALRNWLAGVHPALGWVFLLSVLGGGCWWFYKNPASPMLARKVREKS